MEFYSETNRLTEAIEESEIQESVAFYIDPAQLGPSIEQIARYFGGPRYRPDAHASQNIQGSLELALALIDPVATFTFHALEGFTEDGTLYLKNGLHLEVPPFALDRQAHSLVVGIASLGSRLETHCRSLARQNEIYRSTLLDAVGIAMLDMLDSRLCCALNEHARKRRLFAGRRFSPGLEGYPLERQRVLFQLALGETAGVSLNAACIMEPVKSISFFRLLSSADSDEGAAGKCRRCHLLHCQFRMAH